MSKFISIPSFAFARISFINSKSFMHVHVSLTVYESLIFAAIMQGTESTEEMVNP